MGLVKGGFQRLLQTVLYFILFLCAGIILGVYSYFLSVLANRNSHIPQWEKAVEGISGAAVLYLICAVVLTCCLGGVSFFAFLALVLDVLFAAAFIAIAVLTRHGASSCKGNVNTPIGSGPASTDNGFGNNGFGSGSGENVTYAVHYGLACRLNTAVFAVSIIGAFLFLCTAAMQVMLVRHHKKEKRLGPSPSNNYTSGYGKKGGLFSRKNKKNNNDIAAMKDAEAGNGHVHNPPLDGPVHDTATYTNGTTTTTNTTHGTHAGYYTAPTGTAAENPYGYRNTATNY